jgi:hypothetical protein
MTLLLLIWLNLSAVQISLIDKRVKDGAKEIKLKQGGSLQLKNLTLTPRTAKI